MSEQRGVDPVYQHRLADLYDATSRGVPGDVPFYVEEARKSGGPVLEIGCGTGRVLLPIAQAGVRAVGLDVSHDMLRVARTKIDTLDPTARERIRLVHGDMRAFDLGECFSLILIPFRAFQHNLTVEDQRACLRCIARHLKPDGRLILDVFDPLLEAIVDHMRPTGLVQRMREIVSPATGRRVAIFTSRSYDLVKQQLLERRVYEEMDETGQVTTRRHGTVTLRFAYRYEMQHLLELCGYMVEALYGDFSRGEFQHGGEQIWVMRYATRSKETTT